MEQMMTEKNLDFKMFTLALWAVGNMMSVSDLVSSQSVRFAIIEYTCFIDCVAHFAGSAVEIETETLEQIVFFIHQCSLYKTISIAKLEKLKYIADICIKFD